MLMNLFAVLVLLAINAFFVATEFALVKARGFRIDALAQEGSATARLTQRIQANLESYLAACQLGITMASLGLGWVGEPAVAAILEPLFHSVGLDGEILHTASFVVGFVIFSSLHIVVGEQVPKTFAIRKPEPVSMLFAYPLHICYLLVYPLNWLLNHASRTILGLFGVEEASHMEILTDAELKGLIEVSGEHGDLDSKRAKMLQSMFDFDGRIVASVMAPRNEIEVLDLDKTFSENMALIKATRHSRFPVVRQSESGEELGVILSKDVYTALVDEVEITDMFFQQMMREPLCVPESQSIGTLFEVMRKQRSHMALVIDEYGAFSGMVTMEDLLEEIVGEISDEMDEEVIPTSVLKMDQHWETEGLTYLGDVSRAVGINTIAADIQANTVSGLFMSKLQRLPLVGDEVTDSGFRFTVLTLDQRRVGRVMIERMPEVPATPVDKPSATAEANESAPES